MKNIVCYSGGHSSALVAVEVVRRFGAENTVLLNHDIHPSVEDADIKRFKLEVAAYLGVPITYANMPGWNTMDQFNVCMVARGFKFGNGTALCTNRMKTAPFHNFLDKHFADKNCIIYYGFDKEETARIQRRSSILAALGYQSDYPLAFWNNRTIHHVFEIGIQPPGVYSQFKHANCIGCLKAKKQHWYCVYCLRPDVWEKAKLAEDAIGYSIQPNEFLDELEPMFKRMKDIGIEPTEKVQFQTFWADVKKKLNTEVEEQLTLPCECLA